eukprot:332754_1
MAWLYMFLWMLFTTSSACTFEHNSPTFLQDGTKIGNIILGEIIEITFELRMNDTCPIPSGWCKLIHVFNQSYDINGDPIYNDSELKIPYINIPESTNGIRMIFSEPNAPGGKVKQTFSSGSYPNLHTAMIDNNFHTLLILICCQCACFVIYKKQKNKLKDILKPTTTNINPGTALQMQQIQSSSVMQQIQSSSVATTGSPNASGQIVLAGTDTSNAFKHDHENSDSDEIYNNSPPMDDITPMTPIAAVNAINIATNTKGFDSNNTYSGTNNITYSDNNDNNDETAEKQYEGKVVNLITGDKNIDDIDDDMYEPAKETDVGHDVGDDEDELYISNGDVEKTKDTTKGYIN